MFEVVYEAETGRVLGRVVYATAEQADAAAADFNDRVGDRTRTPRELRHVIAVVREVADVRDPLDGELRAARLAPHYYREEP